MSIEPIAWQCDCGELVPVTNDTCAACGHARLQALGATCGKCGSEDVHFQPCVECEFAQTFTCFGCGAMYHLDGTHGDGCSRATDTEPRE